MWKRSLLQLLLEFSYSAFSHLLRRRSKSDQPAAQSNPKANEPMPQNVEGVETPRDVRIFARKSWTFPGETGNVDLSPQGVSAILSRLEIGDRSLCELFGIAPEDFTTTLRNAGVLSNPSSGGAMPIVSLARSAPDAPSQGG